VSRFCCARCKPFTTILRLQGVLYVWFCLSWIVVSLTFISQSSIFHVHMLSRSLYGWQLLWPVENFNQLGLKLLKITWKNKNPRAITLRKIIRPHTCYVTHHDIIQLLTFVEVNIRIYRSKIYDICRGRSRSRGKYHISWNDRSLY
jgi:hypothetical protein